MYNYSKVPSFDKILVLVVNHGVPKEEFDRIYSGIADRGKRFGFTVNSISDYSLFKNFDGEVIHSIHLCSFEFNGEIVNELGQWISSRTSKSFAGSNTASISFKYTGNTHFTEFSDKIEKLKNKYNDSINFLRPDIYFENSAYVSDQKIWDNSICDSVRVKYKPQCQFGNFVVSEHLELSKYFERMSEIYKRLKLWHRSMSDGYFAVRFKSGFAITATKTYKFPLDTNRISFVKEFNENSNEIHYDGNFLPSSDSVEAAILFRECPSIDWILHSHASDQFTRNQKFLDRVLVPELPYGEPELGHALVDGLRNVNDGFVIMKEHGEVFSGQFSHFSNLEDFIKNQISK